MGDPNKQESKESTKHDDPKEPGPTHPDVNPPIKDLPSPEGQTPGWDTLNRPLNSSTTVAWNRKVKTSPQEKGARKSSGPARVTDYSRTSTSKKLRALQASKENQAKPGAKECPK